MLRPGRNPRVLALTLLIAGCGDAPKPQAEADAHDPAIAAALNDQLMVDPDLAGQNGGDSALEGGGVASAAIPTPEKGPQEIAKARAEALALAGGKLPPAQEPVRGGAVVSETVAGTAALALQGAKNAGCVARLDYTFAWAARMPQALPIYPRAAVHEAAGVDGGGCRVRAINFRTPVPAADVAGFYVNRASAGGYRFEYAAAGESRTLAASKGAARAFVLIRPGPDGLTEVDLVTSEG